MTTGSELKDLFLEAIDLPPRERRDFLSGLEHEKAGLRGRVESLIAAHERAEAAAAAHELPEDGAGGGLELPARLASYELTEELASGGSGVVYRARQLDLGRTVAIKLLRSGRLATDAEVQRFRAEAEVAARLDHPSIVPVHEVGTYEGRHFISMKLIDGPSLDRCVARYRDDPRAAAELVAKIARAVDHGHRHGVLHRDVKPSNVLLDGNGTPYVADFGTAKLVDETAQRTVTGWIIGTPSYMAPEQAAVDGKVSVATDVHALGCVLYELLVGRPPFVASGLIETLRRVQEEEPVRVRAIRPEIHRDLETICHTCLAKEPARRYRSAQALAEDLERWLTYQPIRARPSTRAERIWLAWRRKPLVSSLVAAVALLSVALVVGSGLAGFELRAGIERTREAEELAREQLRNAYLAEARAVRNGGQAGRRGRALDLLAQAAVIRPGTDVVNEGVASLALTDLVTERAWSRRHEDENLVCFDAGFERRFVGRLDGTLEVRRCADDGLIGALVGNGHPAWRARFSPDGRYLALVHHVRLGREGALFEVWNVDSLEKTLSVAAVPDGRVDFAPDRPAVALCWKDGRLHERDLETLADRTLAQLDRDDLPRVIRYSPTGDRIAVSGVQGGSLQVFSRAGDRIATLAGSAESYPALSWSPDGTRIVAASRDHRAYVWDVASGKLVTTLVGHGAEVVQTAFPHRDLVATYSWDGTTRLWDLRTGTALFSSDEALCDASSALGRVALATFDQVRVAALVHGGALRTLHGHDKKDPECLAVDPGGRFVASGGQSDVFLWDLRSGARLARLADGVRDLRFHPQGGLLAGSYRGLERWEIEGDRLASVPVRLHSSGSKSVTTSADGSLIATLGGGKIQLLYDDPSRETLIPAPVGTSSVVLSQDGERIAAGSYRGSGVHVWHTSDGVLETHLEPGETNCKPDFSPDGRWLAFGTLREYHVYRVGTWELEYRIPRGGGDNTSAKVTCFSPDGALLATTLGRWKVGLIDAAGGRTLAVLEPPERQQPNSACFTADGKLLLVATAKNTILVWDLARLRQELGSFGLDAGLGPGWTWPARPAAEPAGQ